MNNFTQWRLFSKSRGALADMSKTKGIKEITNNTKKTQ